MNNSNTADTSITDTSASSTSTPTLPAYDHIVVVVLENHGYSEVIGSEMAPFLNNTLATGGVLITNAYGQQHPSQPNYLWLFSGSNQGITGDLPPSAPWCSNPNLYTALLNKYQNKNSRFFGGFVDSGTDSPLANYYAYTPNYASRHVPWLNFTNINGGNPAGITQDFGSQFPNNKDFFFALPLVSFVIPALNHDMHNYDNVGHGVSDPQQSRISIGNSDVWLQQNLGAYAQWATTNNSLLVIVFDEDSTADWVTPVKWGGNGTGENPYGMTSPELGFNAGNGSTDSGPNQIAMIFYGANLNTKGPFSVPGEGVNSINLLRTIEAIHGLEKSGAQTALATQAGMTDGPILGIFKV